VDRRMFSAAARRRLPAPHISATCTAASASSASPRSEAGVLIKSRARHRAGSRSTRSGPPSGQASSACLSLLFLLVEVERIKPSAQPSAGRSGRCPREPSRRGRRAAAHRQPGEARIAAALLVTAGAGADKHAPACRHCRAPARA
jgi:hypothetical protein